jgi:outer membrane protein OmpA-like peptidoglycan-associated protein
MRWGRRLCLAAPAALAFALALSLILMRPAASHAEDLTPIPWSVRSAAGLALMTSVDQRGWLGYDEVGVLGDVQFAYQVRPWFEPKAGVLGGAFLARDDQPAGGLLAPFAGALFSVAHHELRPYAQADVGVAFTGALIKPLLRIGIGLDVELTRAFALGPVLNYGQVFQTARPGIGTSDARFLWVGIGIAYRPVRSTEPPKKPEKREVMLAPPEPPRPVEPSTHLMELIERTLPSDSTQVELLAPVLFEFDKDALLPVGVAMLHEVARELRQRPELELVEIQGYADSRGGSEYNRALSNRRAQRVFDWLVAHEVAPERLRIAAEGATGFVEQGTTEEAHEQNRRVVFRVIKVRAPAEPAAEGE